jgi:hypothetical protein
MRRESQRNETCTDAQHGPLLRQHAVHCRTQRIALIELRPDYRI